MDRLELESLVSKGEGFHTEFKRKLPESQKLIREAVAFANSKGGWLFIGVDDDGTICGLKDHDEAVETFQLAANKYSEPVVSFTIFDIPLSRKRSVVAIRIPEASQKPVICLSDSEKGKAMIRLEDKSVTASTEMFLVMKQSQVPKNTLVEYGRKEEILMKYLEKTASITVKEFSQTAKISKFTASRTLVHLVRASILKIIPKENEDQFELVINKQ